jgi:glycosyltransferase involved in cell wall biosynthesis
MTAGVALGRVSTIPQEDHSQAVTLDVAIILHDLRGGGAERAMLRLAMGMIEAGRRVAVLLINCKGEYLKDVPAHLPLIDLKGGSVLGSIPALARWIATNHPKSILSALTHVNIAVLAATKLAGFKGNTVVSERNQISEKAATARGLREKLTYRLAPSLYRMSNAVVAVSQGVAEDVTEFTGLERRKVHFVHNPVFDETLLARAREAAPHPWLAEEPRQSPVIIAVGRLHVQKDFPTLIRAFARLRERREARLIIFGEGVERPGLERLIEETGHGKDIDLPGFCSNPFAAMARADLQVLSSRWEGFPNVLVEGMSCGTAVVATDCPSGPREILDGGKYGPLVAMGDDAAMAEAMEHMLAQPDAGAICAERAKTFSVANAAERYLAILGV